MQTVEIRSLAEWRAWLRAHHAQGESIWLVTWKASDPERYVAYDDIVDEAIAWGWIDSLPRSLDEHRSMRRLSPRSPRSAWSKNNKARVARLEREGRMRAPGRAAVAAAKANGTWSKLDAVETLAVPPDLNAALAANPPAAANFDAFPKSSKRNILEWIGSAKAPATRAARIATTATMAARNLRANHARQPKGAEPTSPGR